MDLFASLIVTVMGGVICHYIIKWLSNDTPSAATLGFLMFVVKSHELLHFSLPIGIIAYVLPQYNMQCL